MTALTHVSGPMMVLAGPGSGKTTVITHRIIRLLEAGIDPSGILVITFTKAAAGEMKERFLKLCKDADGGRVSFGTFHSVFYQILRLAYRFPAGNVIGEEEKREYFREFLKNTELEIEDEAEFISSIIGEISYVKGGCIDLSCYYSQNCPEEWFKKLYRGYEEMLRTAGKLDFDDMLVMCHELFTARPDILSAWQKKYRYILIDEFQDINSLQYEIVRMLALPENNLFIVGDDDQSIYRFRGARPEIMLGFENDYPGAKRVLLGMNYRSSREIVETSLRLIGHNKVRFLKELTPFRGAGRPVELRVFENPLKEAERLASAIRAYSLAGVPYGEVAVLYRTGTEAGLVAEKLMEYNIPFKMRDALPNLYHHWIARDFFSYLALGDGGRKRSDFFRIMNRPNRYFSREAFPRAEVELCEVKDYYQDKDWMEERIDDLEADLRTIGRLKPQAAVRYIRKAVGYDEYLKNYAKFRRIRPEELFETADQLEESAAGFGTFSEWLEHAKQYEEEMAAQRMKQSQPAGQKTPAWNGRPEQERKTEQNGQIGALPLPDMGAVTLSTMHSAKGLEFTVVFVVDVNEGIIPHHKAVKPADIEEERRLFYVALTRAKRRLYLFAVRERFHRKAELSRFLKECIPAQER